MAIPAAATLDEKDWKKVLGDKQCKTVKKTGISEHLRDYKKYLGKDAKKAYKSLNDLRNKIKAAKVKYATIGALITYLDKLDKVAKEAERAKAPETLTSASIEGRSFSDIMADKNLRQAFKDWAKKKAYIEEELEFLSAAAKANSDTAKGRLYDDFIDNDKVDVAAHIRASFGNKPSRDQFIAEFKGALVGLVGEIEFRMSSSTSGFGKYLDGLS